MPFLGALNRGKRARAGEYDPSPAPVLAPPVGEQSGDYSG